MSNKFWAVWRKTGGGAPNKKHETKDDALIEAQRLAVPFNYFSTTVIGIEQIVAIELERSIKTLKRYLA